MNRKKLVVLAIDDENKKGKEKKVNQQINLDTKPKKKVGAKKIVLSVAILGMGAYLFMNQHIISDLFKSKPNLDTSGFAIINGENKKSNEPEIPQVNFSNKSDSNVASPVNEELQNAIKKKEELEKMVQEELPTLNLNQSKNDEVMPSVASSETLPSVSLNANSTQTVATPPQNSDATSNSDALQKELSMLLKNSSFKINTKKDSLSLFINNINFNIGEEILNNGKFKLKDINMVCVNNSLPSFTFNIADAQTNNTLFTKELRYSDNKKIILSFDSLSITELDNNIENIYIPSETIFKDFKLNSINEKGSLLEFDFSCQNKKITISGAELSAIQ